VGAGGPATTGETPGRVRVFSRGATVAASDAMRRRRTAQSQKRRPRMAPLSPVFATASSRVANF
jgi:hypothetical protein